MAWRQKALNRSRWRGLEETYIQNFGPGGTDVNDDDDESNCGIIYFKANKILVKYHQSGFRGEYAYEIAPLGTCAFESIDE